MARGPRFAAIPEVPRGEITDAQYRFMVAIKEDLELLLGMRGGDNSVQAVTHGTVTIAKLPKFESTKVTAAGAGVSISGTSVPTYSDYIKLIADMHRLNADVANIYSALNTLIAQLKG